MSRLLIHIGYHKTGTSWLQKKLFGNIEAGFLRVGGPGVNARRVYEPKGFAFNAIECRKRFEVELAHPRYDGVVPVLSSENLSGSLHAGGYDSKENADRLASVFPDARILIVIREQASAILASYRQYVSCGGPATLKRYLRPPPHGAWRIPRFRPVHFAYHRLIGYYHELFGKDRVLVLPYEMFHRQPQDFIERIITYAGAKPEPGILESLPYDERVNPSLSAISLAMLRWCSRIACKDAINAQPLFESPWLAMLLRRLAGTAGLYLPSRLHRKLEKSWQATTRRLVTNRFKESNFKTAQLTGLDLRAFGYNVKPCHHAPRTTEKVPPAGRTDLPRLVANI